MKEFHSLTHLAAHLGELALAQHEMEKKALEKATKLVQKRAQEKIGEYQEQVGPFIAWPELADSTKGDRARQGFAENDPLLRTGALRDSIERMVVDSVGYVGSNSDIAVYQELGTEKMPPRSFLGGAAVEKIDEICQIVGDEAVTALVGEQVHMGRIALKE
jgi:HK97 gp10 family phage protein